MASLTIDGRRVLTPRERSALRSLRSHFREVRLLVVGATALRCFGALSHRVTEDVDLVVCADAGSFEHELAKHAEWSPDSGVAHRWRFESELRVDIVAVGAGGTIPAMVRHGDREFNTNGIASAFAHAEQLYLGEGVGVSVAVRASIVVLKSAAFLDRPEDRRRDVDDLVALLETYLGVDDDRRFADEVLALEPAIDVADVDAFVLGRDVRWVATVTEVDTVIQWVQLISEEARGFAAYAVRRASGRGRSLDGLGRLLAAFRRGLVGG